MHLIAFGEEQFSEVGAVLAGDAGDECDFSFGSWCSGLVLKLTLPTTRSRSLRQAPGAKSGPDETLVKVEPFAAWPGLMDETRTTCPGDEAAQAVS